MPSRTLAITNKKGLHARASAKFVEVAEAHNATIRVSHQGETVGGDSIMGLLLLAAAQGANINVDAEGPEADAALSALEALITNKFGEGE